MWAIPLNKKKHSYHPLVEFLYFFSVLFITFVSFNAISLALSFVGSFLFMCKRKGIKDTLLFFIKTVPVFLLFSLINPLFNHRGITTLAILPDGNPLTKEAVFFGIAAGAMVFNAIVWFSNMSDILTEEKIVYIFGLILPKGALLLSMSFRFIPLMKESYGKILATRKLLGEKGILLYKNCLLILFNRFFEGSIITSDSMCSRGYDTGRRTSYNIFILKKRDIFTIAVLVLLFFLIFLGLKNIRAVYYPYFKLNIDIKEYILLFLLFVLIPLGRGLYYE